MVLLQKGHDVAEQRAMQCERGLAPVALQDGVEAESASGPVPGVLFCLVSPHRAELPWVQLIQSDGLHAAGPVQTGVALPPPPLFFPGLRTKGFCFLHSRLT